MCPFDADFKHFRVALGQDFLRRRKVSSIMRAKLLSIMPFEERRVTAG
jgi:hypothetical protein